MVPALWSFESFSEILFLSPLLLRFQKRLFLILKLQRWTRNVVQSIRHGPPHHHLSNKMEVFLHRQLARAVGHHPPLRPFAHLPTLIWWTPFPPPLPRAGGGSRPTCQLVLTSPLAQVMLHTTRPTKMSVQVAWVENYSFSLDLNKTIQREKSQPLSGPLGKMDFPNVLLQGWL